MRLEVSCSLEVMKLGLLARGLCRPPFVVGRGEKSVFGRKKGKDQSLPGSSSIASPPCTHEEEDGVHAPPHSLARALMDHKRQ
jgi:hypothetical protein